MHRHLTPPRMSMRQGVLAAAVGSMLILTAWPAGAATGPSEVSGAELRRQRQMANELFRATSSDAASFERALTNPATRAELERVFKKKLDDHTLHAMADQAHAEAVYWTNYRRGIDQMIGAEYPYLPGRRVPGKPAPATGVEPITNPENLPPPRPFDTNVEMPVPDRWRILDALGRIENPLDPYNTNTLKADKPIFGDDWFFLLGAISDTLVEPARVPTGVGAQFGAHRDENSTFGRYGRLLFTQTNILELALIKGNTAFKPPDIEIRFTPVLNFNHTDVGELNAVFVDPQRGTVRDDYFIGLQEGFIDYHLRNVSEYYDFDSLRVGIQPFNADFRGFLFQSNELGVRLFGDRDANRWQYNLAFFNKIEKDTNSQLNDLGKRLRKDQIYIANLFHQDFPVPGFTSQITYVHNDNTEGNERYYDNNGFLIRPAQIGDNHGYNYHVNYFGYNGDGHFGRLNLTASAYYEFGDVSHNQFSSNPQNKGATVDGFFLAAEPSYDMDWIRIRASALWASGAHHPQSGHLGGFDAIVENPQFAGADTSFWIRQSIPLIGGGLVALNTGNGVLADLRSAKGEGQSNFANPGVMLLGIGGDFDILPELRLATNINYLRFDDTSTLEYLRHVSGIPNEIGYDLSAALTYRPLFSNNIVLRLSGGVLLPGSGLKALYNTPPGSQLFTSDKVLYSVLANVILTY
jgi:hypothetical protein